LIDEVGSWVIDEAINQIKLWSDKYDITIHVSINLSPRQIVNKNISKKIIDRVFSYGINPEYLILEITESTLMENIEDFNKEIELLNSYNIRVEIDDFGTGYSSLAYLKKLPIFALKIDRAFIKDLPEDEDDVAITTAIIRMSNSLGKEIIAEGVETESQLEFLKRQGCRYIQGYYFSKPLPVDEFEKFVEEFEIKWKK